MLGISSKTVYAIAALKELGRVPEDEVLKIKEIAANANIPQNFLEQILLELKNKAYLPVPKVHMVVISWLKSLKISPLKMLL